MTQGRPGLIRLREEVAKDLRSQIAKGHSMKNTEVGDDEEMDDLVEKETRWSDFNAELLASSFSDESLANNYRNLRVEYRPRSHVDDRMDAFNDRIGKRISFLQDTLKRLKLFPETTNRGFAAVVPPTVAQNQLPSEEVFIVHGHDEGTKNTIARFIEVLGLKATILHELPNKGRTIIEKVEQHSNVGLALVLLTPDDIGAPRSRQDQLKPRARQNVIFEMGFFAGRLGRSKITVLHSEGVEIPTDYHGVVYIPLDSEEAWKLKLAKELKAAGLPINTDHLV
jgi:predicted nucleotide-binding protein